MGTSSPLFLILLAGFAAASPAQTQKTPAARASAAATASTKIDKANAYYYYALGHLYAELAGAYGNRGEYFTKAIDNYRLAMKADPGATFLSEEVSDLYIQAGKLREAVTEAEDSLKQNPDDLSARRILARIYTRMIGDSQQNRIDENMLKKAIEQYQAIVAQEPKVTEHWLMLGRLHKVAQNSVESEKAYKKVLDLEPDNEDAMTGLAMVYADLGDTKSASDLLRRASEKTPSLRSLTALAGLYEQMRDYALAAETFKRALEMAPSNLEVKKAYAQNLLLSDRLGESLKVYEELAGEDPKDVQSLLRISQIYRQQKKFDRAREISQKAKDIDPNNVEIRYNDVSLLEAEDKLPEAIAQLNDIILSTAKKTYNPSERGNRVMLLERLAVMYRANEQFQKAIETFRQAGEVDPDLGARVSAQIVDTHRIAKQYSKAEQEAEIAYKNFPGDRTVVAVRASVLADNGKGEVAIAEMKKLLDGKNDRETYLSMAQIYEKLKNYTAMAQAIDSAEKLSQTKDDKEAIYFIRGAMYEKLKKFDLAEAEFRKVLAVNPNSASALNYLGYMLADQNIRTQEALQLIGKALEQDPNNGAYLDSLGWVLYRLNRLPEAEDNLKRSLEKISRDPTVHDHLGDVYFREGKLKEAIAQWQASLKEWEISSQSDMDSSEIARVQKKLEGAKIRLAKEGPGIK